MAIYFYYKNHFTEKMKYLTNYIAKFAVKWAESHLTLLVQWDKINKK